MKGRSPALRPLLAAGVMIAAWHFIHAGPRTSRAAASVGYGELPLSFEVNEGQFDAGAKFVTRANQYRLTLDQSGNAYLAGSTLSYDFPVVDAFLPSTQADRSGFVAKVAADGSGLAYSSYLGGSRFDQAQGIAVDTTGAAYMRPAGSALDFSTLLGEGWARGVALDASRNVYVTAASGIRDQAVANPLNANIRRAGVYITKLSLDQ